MAGPANELRLSCKAAPHGDGDERHAACADLRMASQTACRRPEPLR